MAAPRSGHDDKARFGLPEDKGQLAIAIERDERNLNGLQSSQGAEEDQGIQTGWQLPGDVGFCRHPERL